MSRSYDWRWGDMPADLEASVALALDGRDELRFLSHRPRFLSHRDSHAPVHSVAACAALLRGRGWPSRRVRTLVARVLDGYRCPRDGRTDLLDRRAQRHRARVLVAAGREDEVDLERRACGCGW